MLKIGRPLPPVSSWLAGAEVTIPDTQASGVARATCFLPDDLPSRACRLLVPSLYLKETTNVSDSGFSLTLWKGSETRGPFSISKGRDGGVDRLGPAGSECPFLG